MKLELLRSMLTSGVSLDCETAKIQPGLLAPPVVIASLGWVHDGKIQTTIVDRQGAIDALLLLLKDRSKIIVNLNVAFDMLAIAVDAARLRGLDLLPYIHAAYAEGRVYDPAIAEALHHIGRGHWGRNPITRGETYYSLEDVHFMVTGKSNAKANDKWRTSYWLLKDYPIDQWREIAGDEAVDYPRDDASNTLEDALAQAGLIPNVGRHEFVGNECARCHAMVTPSMSPECRAVTMRMNMHSISEQCYTAFCMLLGAAWGLRVNPKKVAELKYRVTKDYPEEIKPFVAAGVIREDGSMNESVMKRLVAIAYGAKDACQHCGRDTRERGRKGKKYLEVAPAGKKINAAGNNWINCDECDGTGFELSGAVPRTDKGAVMKGRDQLNESGDNFLMQYASVAELDKIRDTYIPWMEESIKAEYHYKIGEPLEDCIARIEAALARGEVITHNITLSPNCLVETTRTSYRDKTQTQPRKGGVRNCFEPDDGFVYYSNDYTGIEMAAWAQVCLELLKHSDLADALNTGVNAHGKLGAMMCGLEYNEFMRRVKAGSQREKDFRQGAKWGNFGFMGGAGARRLVVQVREQGEDTPHPTGPIRKRMKDGSIQTFYKGTRFCLLIGGADRCSITMNRTNYKGDPAEPVCSRCLECSEWIRETWFKTWREAKPYFNYITTHDAKIGSATYARSNITRGGLGFTDGSNGHFQLRAAFGAKAGLRMVLREQTDPWYRPRDLNGEQSILFQNSRTIVLLHDEQLGVARIPVAPECAERVTTCMVAGMRPYIPDVKVEVEPTLMPAWYKEAACVRDANGRLLVWQPKH